MLSETKKTQTDLLSLEKLTQDTSHKPSHYTLMNYRVEETSPFFFLFFASRATAELQVKAAGASG
jgi:hypothetical protein